MDSILTAALATSTALLGSPDSISKGIAKGFIMKSVMVHGKPKRYVVYVPPAYDPDIPMPTIVFLNGMGECGTDGLRQITVGLGSAVMADVSKWPFIIIFPQKSSPDTSWKDEESTALLTLEATQNEYNVDASRLYLTGISQGGYGVWSIGSAHKDMFAAMAPICGWGDKSMAESLVGVPIWAFHGDADSVVPVSSSHLMADYLKAAGGACQLTIYPEVDHNSWDKAYREEKLNEWFLEHQK